MSMSYSSDPLFHALFDQMAEPQVVVKPNAPDFTIVLTNRAYAAATGFASEQLAGQSLWKMFGSDMASANAREVFEAGLADAMRHHTKIKLPIFRFDLAVSLSEKKKPRWWQVDILPVTGADGETLYLSCTTRNVTIHVEDQSAILKGEQNEAALLIRQLESDEQVKNLQGELGESRSALQVSQQEMETSVTLRTKDLSDSEYELSRVIAVTPVGLLILKGREFRIKTVNRPMLELWGRKKEEP